MKRRSVGDVLCDMEVLLDELVDIHELQHGDILSLVNSQLELHRPDAREVLVKGKRKPTMRYTFEEED